MSPGRDEQPRQQLTNVDTNQQTAVANTRNNGAENKYKPLINISVNTQRTTDASTDSSSIDSYVALDTWRCILQLWKNDQRRYLEESHHALQRIADNFGVNENKRCWVIYDSKKTHHLRLGTGWTHL